MTVKQQIAQARQHLAIGNDYSYRALMSASIRSAMSSQSANQYYKACAEDGFDVLNLENPTPSDIEECPSFCTETTQGYPKGK